MTLRNDKARMAAGSINTSIACENEREDRNASPIFAQRGAVLAEYRLVRDTLRIVAPDLRVCLITSCDGSALEIYGRAPKAAALQKIRRGNPTPAVRWRTPCGGLFGVSLADLDQLVAAVSSRRRAS